MRWQVKDKTIEKGKIETVKKFLWFPKRIGDEVRWLEVASWERIYRVSLDRGGYWDNRKWV